jgi:Xaa-Pro aminopeptidase
MILSDEPGYYEDGKFGIRIENIVKIVPADTKHNFQGTVHSYTYRTCSVVDPDPRGQKLTAKIKKVKKCHVLKLWMFSFED